jgi:hyperosmotically inducible protein
MTKFPHPITCASAMLLCVLLVPLSGCDKTQNTTASTTIGTEVDDAVLTTKVRSALMSDDNVKSLDIKVKTRKGEVMLSGFASNQAQIDRSIAVAKAIEGVTNVDNQLSLKEGKQTVGNKIDDSVITTRVKSALLGDPAMKSLDVLVTTRKGEVQLSGFVDNESQLARAVDLSKSVEGVTTVENHMSLKK